MAQGKAWRSAPCSLLGCEGGFEVNGAGQGMEECSLLPARIGEVSTVAQSALHTLHHRQWRCLGQTL